jgi:hypothetical protein
MLSLIGSAGYGSRAGAREALVHFNIRFALL